MKLKKTPCAAILIGSAMMTLVVAGCASPAGKVCLLPPITGAEMQLDNQVNKALIDDHVYFSKEGSSGGRSFGGGGCGCN